MTNIYNSRTRRTVSGVRWAPRGKFWYRPGSSAKYYPRNGWRRSNYGGYSRYRRQEESPGRVLREENFSAAEAEAILATPDPTNFFTDEDPYEKAVERSKHLFPPKPGWYNGQYGAIAIDIPHGWEIDHLITNFLWGFVPEFMKPAAIWRARRKFNNLASRTLKQLYDITRFNYQRMVNICRMRYVVLSATVANLDIELPYVGPYVEKILGYSLWLHPIKPYLAFDSGPEEEILDPVYLTNHQVLKILMYGLIYSGRIIV